MKMIFLVHSSISAFSTSGSWTRMKSTSWSPERHGTWGDRYFYSSLWDKRRVLGCAWSMRWGSAESFVDQDDD
jgi:hypothetical protein